MIYQWPAPAKLNLFLYITDRRADGYHYLQTLLQFIDYSDTLIITPTFSNNSQIRLLTPIANIEEKDNLIIKAARKLQLHCWPKPNSNTPGVDISLKKRLPIGGGLGGGSSNAATTLVGLNYEWKCGLTLDDLSKLGLSLGADIPFFVQGHTSFAEGIGEQLNPVYLPEKWYLVIQPPVSISTSIIFRSPDLKRNTPRRSMQQIFAIPFCNAFEKIVIKNFYIVEKHLLWLLEYAPSRLTGTGACIFSEFNTEIDARNILSLTPEWMYGFVARGINTSPLHYALYKKSFNYCT